MSAGNSPICPPRMKVAVPSAPTADSAWKWFWLTSRPSRPMYNAASKSLPTVARVSCSPGVSRSSWIRSSTSWVVARLPADCSTNTRSGAGRSTCSLR